MRPVFEVTEMRSGFTTGSCSAAASAAALTMLLTQKKIDTVTILTPKGVSYSPVIEEPRFGQHSTPLEIRVRSFLFRGKAVD